MEYLYWLHKFIAERGYCSKEKPNIKKRISINGKIRYILKFKTYTYSSFNWIHDLFYQNNVKVIPKNIYDFLTPLALAVWFQDDGGKVSKGVKFSTNCFTYEEIQLLCDVLYEKYKIKASVNSAGYLNQYIIYIPKESMPLFSKTIKPFLVQSMYYKLNGY
jgi:ubiquinol-cytochrome c reductase cytochrome b subunit